MIRYISWLKSTYDYGYNDTAEPWPWLPSTVPDNLLYNSLPTNALDFQSDRSNFTQATFEIAFSIKLCSGSRRNVEESR